MPSQPPRLRLTLLGRFAAAAGEPLRLIPLSAPRHRALIAYLALRPTRSETRERLATLLWGDRPDSNARHSLRQCLSELRRALGPDSGAIDVGRDTVALRVDPDDVDALRFEALARSGAAEDASSLFGGDLLDGVELEESTFADWLGLERQRLRALAAGVFARTAEGRRRAGDGRGAVRAAERLVALDPLRDGSHRLLIELTAETEGRDAALALGRAFAELIERELGAGPEPETRALLDRIRATPSAPPRRPAAPPAETPTPQADGAPHRLPPRAPLALAGAVALAIVAALAGALVRPSPPPADPGPAAEAPADPPGRSAALAELAELGQHLLAVLPFRPEEGAPEAARRLADRIGDDLVNDLARVPGLRVVSPATTRLYRGRAVDVATLGAELGVRYVVEGDLAVQGEAMRVNVALTDASTRLQLWSHRFERPVAEAFDVLDEIARGLARHLQLGVIASRAGAGPSPPADPTVADHLARGWAAMLRIANEGGASGAGDHFEAALALSPSNGSAMLGLAGFHVMQAATLARPRGEWRLDRADELLAEVLGRNPASSMGFYYKGVLHKLRGETAEALAAFRRTLDINPSSAIAHGQLGHTLYRAGRLDEAAAHLRVAMRLSPRDPQLGVWSLFAGQIELERGIDAAAAIEWLSRAVALSPRNAFAHASLAAAHALGGDEGRAQAAAREARVLAPWLTVEAMVERVVVTSGGGPPPARLVAGLERAFAPGR